VAGVFVLIHIMSDQDKKNQSETCRPCAENASAGGRKRSFVNALMYEAGLLQAPRCYSNYRFITVLLAAIIALWLGHDHLPPFTSSIDFHWKLWVSLVIWQPVVEEILFRGIIQGQLLKPAWGQRSWMKISAANFLTSILFVGFHMVNNPPLFSITVIVPSLLLGYFRDSCSSVYPSILMHSAFNALVIEGLLIHGNMVKMPM
jgi:membrane protease YdiL (CAAX protease family)